MPSCMRLAIAVLVVSGAGAASTCDDVALKDCGLAYNVSDTAAATSSKKCEAMDTYVKCATVKECTLTENGKRMVETMKEVKAIECVGPCKKHFACTGIKVGDSSSSSGSNSLDSICSSSYNGQAHKADSLGDSSGSNQSSSFGVLGSWGCYMPNWVWPVLLVAAIALAAVLGRKGTKKPKAKKVKKAPAPAPEPVPEVMPLIVQAAPLMASYQMPITYAAPATMSYAAPVAYAAMQPATMAYAQQTYAAPATTAYASVLSR